MYAGSPDHCNNDVVKTAKEPVEHITHVGIVLIYIYISIYILIYILFFILLCVLTLTKQFLHLHCRNDIIKAIFI